MGSERVRRFAGLVLGIALLAPVTAFAEPSAADRETARSLMDDGDEKAQKQDFQGALESYKAADAIMHVPSTAIEVARMQRKLGLLVEARDTLSQIARTPPKPNEPAPFQAARRDAETLSDEITPLIPSITVHVANVPPGQSAQISFDGETVPTETLRLPRKVNPGSHTIVGKLGDVERTETVTLAEKETRTVTFNFDEARDPDAFPSPVEPPPPPETDRTTSNILFYGGGATAIVGIGVGAVTGLMSLSKVGDLDGKCQQVGSKRVCDPALQGDIDSASTLGTISTISFIVGGVGVGAAIVGLLTAPPKTAPPIKHESDTPPSDEARRVRPFDLRVQADVGPNYWGLRGTF